MTQEGTDWPVCGGDKKAKTERNKFKNIKKNN